MSYIAFDLDALNVCPQVGAACGLSAAEAAHGLLQLWAWCFRSEKADVIDTHLRGFFSGRDAGAALEAFGFVERMSEGWRVRGAARYLRIKQAQRDGGKKGAKNLRRGKKKTSPERVQPEVQPEVDLRVYLRSTSSTTSSASPALTPTTDDRTPNTESKRIPPDGGHQALAEALCATYARVIGSPYPFSSSTDARVGSRNGGAIKTLLGMGIAPTIAAAWERALRSDKFPLVRTLPEFVTRFPHFVGNATTGPPGKGQPRTGLEGSGPLTATEGAV